MERFYRRIQILIISALTGLVFTAAGAAVCFASESGAEAVPEKQERSTCRYAVFCADLSDSYNSVLTEEMRLRIMEKGDEAVILDAGLSNNRQNSQIRNTLAGGIDGIFIQPVNPRGIVTVLREAGEAGVPVIGIDIEPTDLSCLDSFCGTDYLQAGKMLAESLTELLPEGGEVLILSRGNDDRFQSAADGLTDGLYGSTYRQVEVVECKLSREDAKKAVAEKLEEETDLKVIAAGSDVMALGALDALREAENETIRVISIGGSPEMKQEIAGGEDRIIGTAVLSPVAIADAAVGIMNAGIEGQRLKSRYPVETFLMTSENVGNYGLDSWQ